MNNNEFKEYEEFVRDVVNKELFIHENILKFALKYFDKDNSGEIWINEIEEVLKESIGDKTNVHDSLHQIIGEVDLNKDCKISSEEFCSIIKKMLKINN